MDITKCEGTNCPIKEKCFRFTAKADEYQSVFVDVPGKWVDGNESYGNLPQDYSTITSRKFICDMFWGEKSDEIYQTLQNIVK